MAVDKGVIRAYAQAIERVRKKIQRLLISEFKALYLAMPELVVRIRKYCPSVSDASVAEGVAQL